ncbi:MAG: hypothetical protein WCZ47_03425 [Bacilli bacterium]|jgi:hypothetical protein|nr:hypothetical protein [Bacilli bacterium]
MPEVWRYLIALVIFALLVSLFVLTYLLNKKTKKPENCQDIEAHCAGCVVETCSLNTSKKEVE